MRYDLATMARRARNVRRSSITLRDIIPPAVLASDLYLATYAPIVALWTRHGARIADEYARTVAAMTTDSPADLQSALDAADSEFERLFILLRTGLEDWLVRTERWTRLKFRGAVLSATAVDLETILGPQDQRETLDGFLRWNTALIRDVHEQARKRIADAVFTGVTQRLPARDVAARIRESVAMSKRRSVGIAADQLSRVTSELARERMRDAGLSVYEYVHSRKKHPRKEHQSRDGKLYSEDPAMVGKEIDGKTVNPQLLKGTRAGEEPWCGCRERGVLVWE